MFLCHSLINMNSDRESDRPEREESLIKFESPTSIFVVVPSNSGKSFLTRQILQSDIFKSQPSAIYFCYSVWQSIYDEMKSSIPNIFFHNGLPSKDELIDWSNNKEDHKLIILDDLMMDAADCTDVVHMFCVGSHHYNFTIIHILQNLFLKGKIMRTVSLNCHYFILFKNYRDQLQIKTFGKQVFPGNLRFFMDAFDKATSEKYGYLVVDLNPHSDKTYQLRTNILPGQTTIVYQPQ